MDGYRCARRRRRAGGVAAGISEFASTRRLPLFPEGVAALRSMRITSSLSRSEVFSTHV
jgi:hypothetical protein